MRAVGEAMSIGKTYKETLQKSIRSLEIGRYGLGFAGDYNAKPLAELMELLAFPTSERQFIMYEALRKGATVEELAQKTHIKAWFIGQMKELVELEEEILRHKGGTLPVRSPRPREERRFCRPLPGRTPRDLGAGNPRPAESRRDRPGLGTCTGERGRKRRLLTIPPTMRRTR